MKIEYINTDLELRSKHDLSEIVKAFGDAVDVLHHGKEGGLDLATFEIACGDADCALAAEDAVSRFCDLVESFPQDVKEAWNRCQSRVMDIAFESGKEPARVYRSELKAQTLQRLAILETSVTITIYPIDAYGDNEDT